MVPLTDVVKNLLIINVLVYLTLNFFLPQFNLQPYFTLFPSIVNCSGLFRL